MTNDCCDGTVRSPVRSPVSLAFRSPLERGSSGSGGGGPPAGELLASLATGWDDAKLWDDTETWTDA
jgi:hypothetical protein